MSVKSNKAIWSKFGSPSNNSAKLLLEPSNASPMIALDGRMNGDNIAFDEYSFDAIYTSKSPSASPSTSHRQPTGSAKVAGTSLSALTTSATAVPRKSTAMSLALWYSA